MKKAFSLIELVFAILIIAVISSIAIPKLFNISSSATVNTIYQDTTTITNAIQSYYMLNGQITKITDSVNINKKYWAIEDQKVTFYDQDKECISIAIEENTINKTISSESGEICDKLVEKGIENQIINLLQ